MVTVQFGVLKAPELGFRVSPRVKWMKLAAVGILARLHRV
jgi:hypothetical protein